MKHPVMPPRTVSHTHLIGLLVLATLIGACASHPLGISDEQWVAMNTAQRLQAQQQQAEIDRANAERWAAEARAREAEAARQARELDQRRREARYGERLHCVLSAAEARLGGKWRAIDAVALDLVRGYEIEFNLSEPASQTVRRSTSAYAHFDGQTLALCRYSRQDSSNACARLLGTFEDYRRGMKRAIDAADFLRGQLHCDLAPGIGMPQRLIIER